jgi:murein DD-endopeptidase MepM/ murein hydrolase activator NlpD
MISNEEIEKWFHTAFSGIGVIIITSLFNWLKNKYLKKNVRYSESNTKKAGWQNKQRWYIRSKYRKIFRDSIILISFILVITFIVFNIKNKNESKNLNTIKQKIDIVAQESVKTDARKNDLATRTPPLVFINQDTAGWPVRPLLISYLSGRLFGLEIETYENETVISISEGIVVSSESYRGFGKIVIVQGMGGYLYIYTGLKEIGTTVGAKLKPGDVLGTAGIDQLSRKNMILFMVYHNNIPIDPFTIIGNDKKQKNITNASVPKRFSKIDSITIDPGHGGKDAGAEGFGVIDNNEVAIFEKDITLSIAGYLYEILADAFPETPVFITRIGDRYSSLEKRVTMSNNIPGTQEGTSIFVSIHANASINKDISGFEVWYLQSDEDNKTDNNLSAEFFANEVLRGLNNQLSPLTSSRGIKQEQWYALRNSTSSAVLVDVGFLTNQMEAELLSSSDYQEKIAIGIGNGIKGFASYITGENNNRIKNSMYPPLIGQWQISSPFGWREDPLTGQRRYHTGIDFTVPNGAAVFSALGGTVATVGNNSVYGNYLIINHADGFQTFYAHLMQSEVKENDVIQRGTRIGLAGTTGYSTEPHLHFTVYKNGKAIDPLSVIQMEE